MDTPKSRRQKRTKGLSKKRRNLSVGGVSDSEVQKHSEGGSSSEVSSSPRTDCKNPKISETEREEIRGVEWEFRNLVEADAPVVWGSPQGSPVINTVRSLESPVSKTQNIGHTLKHFNDADCDPPEFLNDMVALCKSIKVPEESETIAQDDNNSEELPKANNVLNESYSNLFDESMNECLLQCSQEYEANSKTSDETLKVNSELFKPETVKCEPKLIESNHSPRKKISLSSGSYCESPCVSYNWSALSQFDRTSPRVGNKNYVECKRKSSTYVYKGRVLGGRKSSVTSSVVSHVNSDVENKEKSIGVPQPYISGKTGKSPKSKKGNGATDPSLDKIKDWCFDDDELLSKIPLDPVEGVNHQKDSPNVCTAFDDSTLFGDRVLKLLDTIESNAVPSCTEKLKCTPEEIEKKRQLAKSKLAKKKLNLRNRST